MNAIHQAVSDALRPVHEAELTYTCYQMYVSGSYPLLICVITLCPFEAQAHAHGTLAGVCGIQPASRTGAPWEQGSLVEAARL